MALVKCPECGQDISDGLSHCPNCGFQLKKGRWPTPATNILLITVAIGLVCFLFKRNQAREEYLINYQKNAIEFVESLPHDCVLMEIIVDSTINTNEVFYYRMTAQGVELRCFDLEKAEDYQLTVQDQITTITNFKYDNNNKCLFLIAKTTNEQPSNRYCVVYIDANNCKTETIAYGIAIYFENKKEITIEKIHGHDKSIDLEYNLAEILQHKDSYINDEVDWGL